MARCIATALILAATFATPSHAATSASRVSILKYYYCLANPLVPDKTRCHL